LSVIVALFDHAAAHLKRPAVELEMDGEPLKLSRCGDTSSYPGCVHISDGGPFGKSRYYGRIDRDGSMTAGRDMTPSIQSLIEHFAVDPIGAAADFGHKTGRCCFCGQKLKDNRSTAVGYGPVCADRYGLAWGAVAEPLAVAV
jgi:hypothetical protein